MKAHMGGNHVTGLNSSKIALGDGTETFKRGATVSFIVKM
jgi:hypothetical protein